MAGELYIDVYLTPTKNTQAPGPKTVLYSYVKDKYTGKGDAFVTQEGNIYVGGSKEDTITVYFVLQTKELVWGADSYKATYEAIPSSPPIPPPNGPIEDAIDLLWISKTGGNAGDRWPELDPEFSKFELPAKNIVKVTMNKKEFKQQDYSYALAFNSYNSAGRFIEAVRDDPQIRDRGLPQFLPLDLPIYVYVGLGILVGIFLAYGLGKMTQKRSRP